MPETPPTKTGISKVWQFFKSSFADRPNPIHGAGLTAFKNEWAELSESDREAIRYGIENATLDYPQVA